jgi:hypothetical protein
LGATGIEEEEEEEESEPNGMCVYCGLLCSRNYEVIYTEGHNCESWKLE